MPNPIFARKFIFSLIPSLKKCQSRKLQVFVFNGPDLFVQSLLKTYFQESEVSPAGLLHLSLKMSPLHNILLFPRSFLPLFSSTSMNSSKTKPFLISPNPTAFILHQSRFPPSSVVFRPFLFSSNDLCLCWRQSSGSRICALWISLTCVMTTDAWWLIMCRRRMFPQMILHLWDNPSRSWRRTCFWKRLQMVLQQNQKF